MVGVEPADGHHFFGSLELAIQEAIFGAGSSGQGQSAVSPELPLGTETMRRLDQSDQQGRSNRADAGNLLQQSSCGMFPALDQQFLPGVLAQRSQQNSTN